MAFIPYGKQSINQEDVDAVVQTLQSDFLTTGPKVKAFEDKLCALTGAQYCVSVSNGTAALHLSSLVLLKENDKVLTTPNSFLATSNAILYVKAQPIFVDIDKTGNIDLDLCKEYLKKDSSIKALYAVHFSGKSVDQKKLQQLKKKYKITILEDCAHSLGASNHGVKAGSCVNSDMATFSFHPVKNLTTGEGGAITTNSKEYYEKLLILRNHGMQARPDIAPWHYDMVDLGFNYRLTDIACALGLSQLKRFDTFLEQRRTIALKYEETFKNFEYIKPLYAYDENSVYHLYVVKIDFKKLNIDKKTFVLKMREKEIGLQYHYIPINQQPYYKKIGYGNENHPMMDEYYETAISLPIYPSLSQEEQEYVVDSIKGILNA